MLNAIKPFLGFPRDDPYANRTSLFKLFPTLVTLSFTILMFLLLKPYLKIEPETDDQEMKHGMYYDGKVYIQDIGLMDESQIAAG